MMSSPSRTHRGLLSSNGHEDKKSTRLKSKSFHGQLQQTSNAHSHHAQQLRRPKTDPNLLSYVKFSGISSEISTIPTKLLLNVNIQRSLGAVQVVMPLASTVGDLVDVVVRRYVKEERRPLLTTTDPSCFDLHYSQFSLESIDRAEKLIMLGSRNFFLCLNQTDVDTASTAGTISTRNLKAASSSTSSSRSSCSNEFDKATTSPKINELSCFRFMHFML